MWICAWSVRGCSIHSVCVYCFIRACVRVELGAGGFGALSAVLTESAPRLGPAPSQTQEASVDQTEVKQKKPPNKRLPGELGKVLPVARLALRTRHHSCWQSFPDCAPRLLRCPPHHSSSGCSGPTQGPSSAPLPSSAGAPEVLAHSRTCSGLNAAQDLKNVPPNA